MERQSPPAERVTRVLNTFVANPTERLTIAELTRRSGISKPTCLGIVRTLVATGYLDRDDRTKTYSLGPALVAAGQAAIESLAPIASVRNELTEISERFHLAATAAAFRHDHLMIIERTGPPSIYDPLIQVGVRLPLVPPTGKMAIIFSDDDLVSRWLQQDPDAGGRIDRARLEAVMADARDAGFLVSQAGESSRALTALLRPLEGRGLPDEAVAVVSQLASSFGDEEYLQAEFRPGRSYPVSTVSAPVFDANAKVKLLLVLYVAREDVAAIDIHNFGEALLAAGDHLTAAIGGRNPWRHP